MPVFNLSVSDGRQAKMDIDVPNSHEAINAALNALLIFSNEHFPPPEQVKIIVSDADGRRIATLKLGFSIDYADGFLA
jgi:hypothetical protein